MLRCPISYQPVDSAGQYSEKGLRAVDKRLRDLRPLEFTREELVEEAARRASRMSIGGVQPKLSAVIDFSHESFRIVDSDGRYILKPQHPVFRSLPENEDLTMRLAHAVGIDVPFHGMVYGKDSALSYFIRRFDRDASVPLRIPVEDFAQLSGRTRDTKYDSSVERLLPIVDQHCTFPRVERSKLFRRLIFSFLVGNEDMHLKNNSLISRNGLIELSPAYDLLNTTAVLGPEAEESALPIEGKRRGLTRRILVEYLGIDRCGLPAKEVGAVLDSIRSAEGAWRELVQCSFLPDALKGRYLEILAERTPRLFG